MRSRICRGLFVAKTMSLTNGITGELQSVDGYMNIALEQTKELVNGKLRRNYGDAFVRGNNGRSFLYSFAFFACLPSDGLPGALLNSHD